MADEKMKFLGAGCSRLAYSLGDGWCLKKPIPERLEAGAWQNRIEYENFKLAEEEGLACFPRAKCHSGDWSEIVVEECKHLESDDSFLQMLNLSDSLMRTMPKVLETAKMSTTAEFIGFAVLGWLESIDLAYAKKIVPNVQLEDLARVVPFKAVEDIKALLAVASVSSTPSTSAHAQLVFELLSQSQVLLEIMHFKVLHPSRILVKDIWNLSQWGVARDGRLVVVDAGYNAVISHSPHFDRGKAVEKEVDTSEDFDTFNGQKCNEIFSPSGSPVEWKFFTSRGTEYVLSSEHQARRIKQAGLSDDGLHPWMDRMVFVDEQDAVNAMSTMASIQQTLTPVKIKTTWMPGAKLDIQKLVQGQWQTQLSVTIQATRPQVGKNVLEFMLDGDQGIVKAFHAGHDVTKLKHFDV